MKKIRVKPVPAYLCNPKVNLSCAKKHCFLNNGECFLTLEKRNAIEGAGAFRYFPMTEIIEEEEI